MKTIGIVGGIGPESTIDYYRFILARAPELGARRYPSILIKSVDQALLMELAGAGDLEALAAALVCEVELLARGGAGLAILAANTPHMVFDQVQARSSIPLVSIVTATCEAAAALGLKRLGLLGTRYTMQGRFYPDAFTPRGMSIVVPEAGDLEYVHEKYVQELIPGRFLDVTRSGLVQVMDHMREQGDIDGVILGGTELPLILREVAYPLPLLDTARIHVDATIAAAMA